MKESLRQRGTEPFYHEGLAPPGLRARGPPLAARARIRDAPRVEDQVERASMQAGEEPEERARHVSQRAEPALGQRLVRIDGQRTRLQACGGNAGARSDGRDR